MFRGIYDKQYGATEPSKLFSLAKANVSFVQRLKLYRSLEVHSGCVNTVCWNETGSYILSGADDQHLSVTNPFTGKKCFSIRSGHRANIFSAKFLPSTADKQIISCSGDGKIFYTEVERDDTYGTNCFDCHYGTAYEVTTLPGESSTFLSCGEDGTVRWFDLRMKTSCSKDDCKEDVMINCRRPVTSLSVNPVLPYQLGVACSDSAVRIFDRRMLGTRLMGNYSGRGITGLVCRFTAKSSESRAYRITSLQYSPDGEELLVSYSSEHLYLFSTKNEKARNFEKEVRTPPEPIHEETSFKESVEAVCSAKPETTTATTLESTVPCIPSTSKDPPEVEIAEDTPVAPPTSEETATPEEGATAGTTDPTAKQPPIKRLRLRGDWSDTGPNARPESERQEDEDQSPHVTLMQRMSDMLTRWLDSRPNTQGGEARESVQEEPEQRGETSEQGEPPPEGAVGGDATLPDLTKSRKIAVQENPELIQGLEDIQVPSGSQMDITDRLRNLSKTYQEQKAACIQGRVSSRAADDSFKLSTSPFPVDRIEESSEDAMTGLHAETESSMTLSKAEESSSTLLLNDETSSAIFGKDEEKQSRVVSGKIEELSSNSTAVDNVSFLSQPEDNVEASGSSDVSCGTATTTTAASEVRKKDSEKTPSNFAQNWVEPVLNLHYSTQGTTSSTIQFGFASFQPDSCLSRTTTTANRELSGSSSFTGDSQGTNILSRDRTEHILGANISQGESPVILNSKSSENENTSAVPSIVSESSPIPEVNITRQKSENSSNTGEISESKLDTQDLEDKSSNRTEDIAMAVVIKADTECENVSRTNDSCVDVDESVSRCDQAETGAVETSTENIEERSIKGDDSDKPECDQVSGVALPETETSATSGLQDAGAAASESRPPRQRRIGRSGPPTGDFQLYSPPGGDSSDDSHGEGQAARRRAHWDDSDELERNVAAIRLQSFYRQKHAEREEKELEANQVFQPKVKRKFRGHRNARTMIKEANFWGDHYVMSGSDCGHIFMWDRETAKLAMLLEADRHVVNCLQPHPFDPVLASSGIDYDIKVWAPLSPTPCFDEAAATEIMRRNELMLEETRDTITVPAAFMLRVLASLNHIRTGRSGNNESGSDTD